MKEPFSFGKPINGDYSEEIRSPAQAHDCVIARVQYFHDYLYAQVLQLEECDDPTKIFERLILTHYEIFQDFIFEDLHE